MEGGPIIETSDTEERQLDTFEAVLTGDVSIIADCLAAGCDVNKPDEKGLSPVCAAIRNGEIAVACFLIPRVQLFRKKSVSYTPSRLFFLSNLLLGRRRQDQTKSKAGNRILSGVCNWWRFFLTQSALNYLLSSLDARVMPAFHLRNYWVYSTIRTRFLHRYMSHLMGLVTQHEYRDVQEVFPRLYRSTNLTLQGCNATENLLRYGGDIEPVAIEILIAGLTFDEVNEVEGLAWVLWDWAAIHGYLQVMVTL
ncbi:MAG: hypothetical protein Q9181_003072 [Wetmoreana brouardii]